MFCIVGVALGVPVMVLLLDTRWFGGCEKRKGKEKKSTWAKGRCSNNKAKHGT